MNCHKRFCLSQRATKVLATEGETPTKVKGIEEKVGKGIGSWKIPLLAPNGSRNFVSRRDGQNACFCNESKIKSASRTHFSTRAGSISR